MKKKAQFMPLFIIFLIVVLSILAYTMYRHNEYQESIKLNLEGATTFKIYGLAEKNKYYLEKAAEISKLKAIQELELNTGYLQGQCTNSLITNKILWNTCPKLNVEEDFKTLFKEEFKKYIENQNPPYDISEFETSLNLEEINKIEPIIKIENTDLIIEFNEFSYNLDYQNNPKYNSFSIKYTPNLLISIKSPDLLIYKQICDVLTSCNLNAQISDDQINACISSLNNINGLKIIRNGQIIDLNYGNLDFSVDLKSQLNCQNSLIS